MNRQRFSKDHPIEGLRHAAEHDLVPAHQPSIQKFIDQRILRSHPSQNVLPYRIHKQRRDLVPHLRAVLQEGVGISIESILVVCFRGQRIVDQHVHGEQIDHSLLPSDRPVRVDKLHPVQPIILHFSHRALVRHEPLPRHPLRRIHLQKHQIDTAADQRLHLVQPRRCIARRHRPTGDPDQLNLVDKVDIPLVRQR